MDSNTLVSVKIPKGARTLVKILAARAGMSVPAMLGLIVANSGMRAVEQNHKTAAKARKAKEGQ